MNKISEIIKSRTMRMMTMTTLETVVFVTIASVAMAQQVQNGGGGDAPFARGVSTGLNWVQFLGACVALLGFIGGCVALFFRDIRGFLTGLAAVLVGGALLANSTGIITRLTGLTFA